MGNGQRQTYYFTELNLIKKIAAEENLEINGKTFEAIFFDKYLGENKIFQDLLKNLYIGNIAFHEMLLAVLDIMAYTDEYMTDNNLTLIKIIREVIGSASWSDPSDNRSDYRLDNRRTRVDCISDILSTIVTELEQRSKLVKESVFSQYKPWELPVYDQRYAHILSNETNYDEIQIALFKIREAKLRSSFTDDITPGRVLDLIIENWDCMWNFSYVYEAVEYCVTLIDNLNDNPIIRRKIRKFFVDLNKVN